jgi:hypothetical protein
MYNNRCCDHKQKLTKNKKQKKVKTYEDQEWADI